MGTNFKTQMIPVELLDAAPINPRKVRPQDRAAIQELADSIERVGVLQPLTVRSTGGIRYEVLAGRRRLEAARKAGLEEVPVIVVQATDTQAMDIGLIENLQRVPLDPLDEAAAIATRLAGGQTVKEVAHALGKSPAYVARRSNLRNLHSDLLDQLKKADGFMRAWTPGAIESLALLAPEQQWELVDRMDWGHHPPSEVEVQ